MEALLLVLDVGLLIAVFAWAIKNKDDNGPTTGLFRYKDRPSGKSSPAPQAKPRSWAQR